MAPEFPEPDWKTLRKLREVALERFCQRILTEIDRIGSDSKVSFHDRYMRVFELLQRRDREMASAFDAPHRSRALIQLMAITSHRLLEPEELMRFSAPTRQFLASWVSDGDRD